MFHLTTQYVYGPGYSMASSNLSPLVFSCHQFKLNLKNMLFYVCEYSASMYVCAYMPGACGDQKRKLHPLDWKTRWL